MGIYSFKKGLDRADTVAREVPSVALRVILEFAIRLPERWTCLAKI